MANFPAAAARPRLPSTVYRLPSTSSRRGITLIELLVVVLIIALISAVAIPVMIPALQGRRAREAARAVNVFFSSARTRAMATGRPVGVMIHRQPGRPQAALSMSYVKVPPVWAGDTLDSRVVIEPRLDASGRLKVQLTGWVASDRRVQRGLEYRPRFFRPGDRIQLGGQGHWYNIRGVDDDGDGQPDTDDEGFVKGPPPWDVVRDDLLPPRTDLPAKDAEDWAINETIKTLPPLARGPTEPPGPIRAGLPFRLQRQPTSSAAGGMQMPAPLVIDLAASGVGDRYFSDNEPNMPQDTSPVVVMFAANGSVDRIWTWSPDPDDPSASAASSAPVWRELQPTAPIHLLIGRIERVRPLDGSYTPTRNFDDDLPNWLDLESLWITIQPQTGLITTNENGVVDGLAANTQDATYVRNVGIPQVRRHTITGQSLGGQ